MLPEVYFEGNWFPGMLITVPLKKKKKKFLQPVFFGNAELSGSKINFFKVKSFNP